MKFLESNTKPKNVCNLKTSKLLWKMGNLFVDSRNSPIILEANAFFWDGTIDAHCFLSQVAFILKNEVLEFYFRIRKIPD